ncbi:MAG TPA: hypothetical protein PLH94_04935 [Fimbriimonadaceae bacterium]|nr:hypothetical protein [Fimbriimonadaceae bacterium]
MLTTLVAAIVMGPSGMMCPVMGEHEAKSTGAMADYAGIRFGFCCASCPPLFEKEPGKYLKAAEKSAKPMGLFLFDPISMRRIEAKNAKAFSTYKGIQYGFENETSKRLFDKEPAKFTKMPAQEVLMCPVSGETISVDKAFAFADYKDMRVYFCCADCIKPWSDNPGQFAEKVRDKATKPKVAKVVVK